MTQVTHFTGLWKHLAYVLPFCNVWSLLACTQNKLLISVPFPSDSLLQDCSSSHRSRGGLLLSHTENNYAQKSIFLVSLKFSHQIFWPHAIANIFVWCSAVWYFFLFSENSRSVFYFLCLSVLCEITREIKIPSMNSVSKSHKYLWISSAMGMFQKMINWKE